MFIFSIGVIPGAPHPCISCFGGVKQLGSVTVTLIAMEGLCLAKELAALPDKISPVVEVLGQFLPKLSFRVSRHHSRTPSALPFSLSNFTMPSLLGKRKSRPVGEAPEATADAQELLRRHFEARFKPLAVDARAAPNKQPANGHDSHDSDDSDDSQDDDDESEPEVDSDWGGVSDDEGEDEDDEGESHVVEVVDHTTTTPTTATATMSKRELKAYLVRLLRSIRYCHFYLAELLTPGPVLPATRPQPLERGADDHQVQEDANRRGPTRGQRRLPGQRPRPAAAHCRVPHPLSGRRKRLSLAVPARRWHRRQHPRLCGRPHRPQDHRPARAGPGCEGEHS